MKKTIVLIAMALCACTEAEQEETRVTIARTTRQAAEIYSEEFTKTLKAGRSREAEPIKTIKPEYPKSAWRQGDEGTTWLVIETLSTTYYPKKIKLGRTSGYKSLDDAAIAAANKTLFRPAAAESGWPIESVIDYPIDFRLSEYR